MNLPALALAWRQGGSFRPKAPLSYGGIGLAAVGAVVLLSAGGTSSKLLAPGAVAGALLLIGGPWVWRLALERDDERTARIRSEERSDVAARVHDSVLQTLALIQRHADEPRRVASLARRQERELRGWLYADHPLGDEEASLVASLEAAAGDVEELHGVRVELASAGDCPVDPSVSAVVLASLPSHVLNARRMGQQVASDPAAYYHAPAVQRGLRWLDREVEPDAVVLAHYTTARSIPGASGQYVTQGHWAQSVDLQEQRRWIRSLFDPASPLAPQDRRGALQASRVDYVFIDPPMRRDWLPDGVPDWLLRSGEVVFSEAQVAILRVQRGRNARVPGS